MELKATMQALKSACAQVGDVLKEVHTQQQIRSVQAQKQRAAELQHQQRLLYQQPVAVRLDAQQLQYIFTQLNASPCASSADVLLNQQQMVYVVNYFMKQAWANGDKQTFENLRNFMLPLGINHNLGWLPQLHEDIFDNFVHDGYDSSLTYIKCVPNGNLFFFKGKWLGLAYNLPAANQAALHRYHLSFSKLEKTAQGQAILQKYGISYKGVTYNTPTNDLLIVFE